MPWEIFKNPVSRETRIFFCMFLAFFINLKRKRTMKDKRNQCGTVSDSSLEQQTYGSNLIHFVLRKNCVYAASAYVVGYAVDYACISKSSTD